VIGGADGGFTDSTPRSGTNDCTGRVPSSCRNSSLTARNFRPLDAGKPGAHPPFRRNEFGYTGAGPLALGGRAGAQTDIFVSIRVPAVLAQRR